MFEKLMTKRNALKAGAVAAMAGALFAAQGPRFGGGHGWHGASFLHGDSNHRFDFLADYLDLNDSQRTQVKSILEAARQQSEPMIAQLREGHDAVAAAVKSGKGDTEVQQLAEKQGAVIGQLAGVHAKAIARAYALLTPEQKAKADKLHDRFREAMASRLHRG